MMTEPTALPRQPESERVFPCRHSFTHHVEVTEANDRLPSYRVGEDGPWVVCGICAAAMHLIGKRFPLCGHSIDKAGPTSGETAHLPHYRLSDDGDPVVCGVCAASGVAIQTDDLNPKQQREMMEALASRIQSNQHFRQILMQANPALRRLVYDDIKPHLSFKAKPFFLLVR